MNMYKKIFTAIVFLGSVIIVFQLAISCNGSVEKKTVEIREANLVEAGRYLFFDRRLSVNNTRSCATCHNPQFAFTDGYKRSLGAFADQHQRNTQPLFNLQYLKYLTAADSSIHTSVQQMNNPLFGMHPTEMGVAGNEAEIIQRIARDENYQQLFKLAKLKLNWTDIKQAIGFFLNSLHSLNSPYDKYLGGDSKALTQSQIEGKNLFFSSKLKCVSCHGGPNFSTPSVANEKGDTLFYFNTGLYNIGGNGAYPEYDQGLYQLTKSKTDMGKFRVPSLRNLAFTAPYFHDGSAASLAEVMDAYSSGGRQIEMGIDKGNGQMNPYKHPLISGFAITESEKINLIGFLLALSDTSFVTNPNYQNPFTADETKKK